jgi:hypothetical protein
LKSRRWVLEERELAIESQRDEPIFTENICLRVVSRHFLVGWSELFDDLFSSAQAKHN